MKVKAAKSIAVKPAKAVKAKKPAKKTGKKTLKTLLSEWDKDQEPPPYNLYDIAQGFDDVCNRLSEVTCILDAIMDDVFDITNKRQSTLLCLVDRMTREVLETTNQYTSDLYQINRKNLSK